MKNKALEEAAGALAQAMVAVLEALNDSGETPPSAPRLYTFDDLARMLGKSESTVRQWVCAGEFGEPVKVGSSTRVTQAGWEKFIANHSGPTKKRVSKARRRAITPAGYKGPPLGI